jgi:predicted enzyme related to lactoylglutathione lyase
MRYVHTNIISKDWKTLAGFYIQVFECKLMLPQRRLSGDWLSKGTGVKNAELKGAHLRLPGYGKKGPTLEIFEYSKMEDQSEPISNRKGFGHIAFEVDNVEEVLAKAIKFGGKAYGQVVTKDIEGIGVLVFIYVRDPEGNIIEIQNWSDSSIHPTITSEKTEDTIEVVLPDDKDVVVTIKGKEDTIIITATKEEKAIVNKAKDDDAPKTKRELLNELKQDLEDSKRDIEASKNEIKNSKENAKHNNKNKLADITDSSHEIEIAEEEEEEAEKTKAQLLAELKKEMNIFDDTIEINSDKKIQIASENNTNKLKKETEEKTEVILELPKVAPKLTVEIKVAEDNRSLDLTDISLSKTSENIAKDLRSLTVLTRPNDYEFLFIEWVGKIYKADIVPLKKQFKTSNNEEQNENAWAILPRMKGSLEHLLQKCETDPEMLFDLRLNSIGLSSMDFVVAFENLLLIVLEAENQNATHIRLHYSAE